MTEVKPRWYHDPITERQHNAIKVIKIWLGHEFHGNCKGHAINFIGKYYDRAKEMRDRGIKIEAITNKQVAHMILSKEDPWKVN